MSVSTLEDIEPVPVALEGVRGGPNVRTLRKDGWWRAQAATVLFLRAFVGYATWLRRRFSSAQCDDAPVARRPIRRRLQRLCSPSVEGEVVLRRDPPHPIRPCSRPRLPMELQGGEVWIVFGGDQPRTPSDVYDPHGPASRR